MRGPSEREALVLVAEPITEQQEIVAEPTTAEVPDPSSLEIGTETPDKDSVPDEELEGYFKERSLDGVSKADETEGKEAESLEGRLERLPETDRDYFKGLLEEKQQREEEERVRQNEGRKQAFTTRIGALDSFLKGVLAGEQNLTTETAQQILNTFNNHHADSQHFARLEVLPPYVEGVYKALSEALPTAERQPFLDKRAGHKNMVELAKDFLSFARKGYLAEKAVGGTKQAAVRDYQGWLLEKPERIDALRSRARAPETGGNGVASGGIPSLSQWQSMTLEQREAARKADPQIELKMMGMVR